MLVSDAHGCAIVELSTHVRTNRREVHEGDSLKTAGEV